MKNFYMLRGISVFVLALFTSMVFGRDRTIMSFAPSGSSVSTSVTTTRTALSDHSTVAVGGTTTCNEVIRMQRKTGWVPLPVITSAAYDASTGELVVTGMAFGTADGESNDIIANKFTITGKDGTFYTLTDSENPEITSQTSFTIILSPADIAGVNSILNKNGNSSADATTYNLAAAEDWSAGIDASVTIEDLLDNGIIVSGVPESRVAAEFCGVTLTNMNGEVYADPVDRATAYRFRIKEGDNEQFLDAESEVIWLSDLASYAYNTTYTIDVAFEVDGIWSDYGATCGVTTAAPFTQVVDFLRGTTLDDMNSEIYAEHVPLATAYRFRVKDGSNEQILDTESEVFRMVHLPTYAYNTTYTIDVAVEVNGTWGDYGAAYEISTPAPLTKIASEFCGTTLTDMNSEIYADQSPLATAYRFRIKAGDNEQVIGSESEVFRLSDLAFFAYNTTYTIDVAVEVNGAWSAYGTSCEITTPTPLSKISEFLCGTALEANNMEIYAENVPLATAYRFRVRAGDNEQVIDAESGSFWLNEQAFFAYNTTYTIDVAVEVGGTWSDYGTSCDVSTPAPLSKIGGFLCGTTLDVDNMEIYADQISLATAYRFRVRAGDNEQVIDAESGSFWLNDLTFFAYNTTYTIDVAVEVGGTWSDYGTSCDVSTPAPLSKIGGFLCGTTLDVDNMEIYADQISLVTAYRFRVRAGDNEQVIDAESGSFWLNDLTFFAYNTTYTIDVAVEVDGTWGDYGATCEVTTPAPSTQIVGFLRGTTLDDMNSEIYAEHVPLATTYRFRVRAGGNEQILDTELDAFRMIHLPVYAYNTTYTIDVAVKVNGTWSDYGTAYEISTPAPPQTQIDASLCGTTLENMDSEIYANHVPLATAYRFRVKAGDNEQILDTELDAFRMSHLPVYVYNTTYTIDVAFKMDGTWSDYGTACNITTPTGTVITDVSSNRPDGIYGAGSVIPITINFSDDVNVTGTPVLALNSGGAATYSSGDGSSTLIFNYTVATDEHAEDLDYTDHNSLDLSGGTLRDGNGNDIDLKLQEPGNAGSLGANKNLIIDAVAPASPLSLTAVAGNNQVVLKWAKNAETDLKSYKIYGGIAKDPTALLQTVTAAVLTYTHTRLQNGTTYYYRISAIDNAGNEGPVSPDVTATINVVTEVPTNIKLAAATLYENAPAAALAAILTSTSAVPSATFTYSLVSGNGDTDNALFTISGDEIRTAASLNFEQRSSYAVRVRSTTQHNLWLDKELIINIIDVNEQPTLADIAAENICYTTAIQTVNLNGISAGPDAGQTTTVSVSTTNDALFASFEVSQATGGTATLNYRLSNNASGEAAVTILVRDDGGTANGGADQITRSFTIHVNPLPVITVSSSKGTADLSKGDMAVLTATGGTSYSWSNAAGIISGQNTAALTVQPLQNTAYTVTAVNASGCTTTQSFNITVLEDYRTIEATNIMSPNGDGVNDLWVVKNIELYPNNEVKVFDRAGRVVFSKKSYQNTWDGTLKGAPLAEGTYYSIIDFGDNKLKFKGFITIVRD